MKINLLGRGEQSIYVNDTLVCGCGSDTRGGAYLFRDLSNVLIEREVFFLNHVTKDGGAVYFYRCHGICVRDCVFIFNLAKWGGAIYMEECSDIRISDNRFYLNFASRDGGAVSLSRCRDIHVMCGNRFCGNMALRSCDGVEFHHCQ